mmetsp:Transcript_30629/g.81863  ORF Transcript_30629/g.81863 Transcript_30629/m.81863 type:complete len:315 (-) Transcript_30629:1226-2170(-)
MDQCPVRIQHANWILLHLLCIGRTPRGSAITALCGQCGRCLACPATGRCAHRPGGGGRGGAPPLLRKLRSSGYVLESAWFGRSYLVCRCGCSLHRVAYPCVWRPPIGSAGTSGHDGPHCCQRGRACRNTFASCLAWGSCGIFLWPTAPISCRSALALCSHPNAQKLGRRATCQSPSRTHWRCHRCCSSSRSCGGSPRPGRPQANALFCSSLTITRRPVGRIRGFGMAKEGDERRAGGGHRGGTTKPCRSSSAGFHASFAASARNWGVHGRSACAPCSHALWCHVVSASAGTCAGPGGAVPRVAGHWNHEHGPRS